MPGTGTGLTYSWDFGDGSPSPVAARRTSHVYTSVGTYARELTMANSAGTSVSPPITITVNLDPNPKYYVRTTGSTGPACGPLANPCSTISEAQTNAVANGVNIVRVAGGSYTGPSTWRPNMTISRWLEAGLQRLRPRPRSPRSSARAPAPPSRSTASPTPRSAA